MLRLIRSAGKTLRSVVEVAPSRYSRPIEVTDRIDLELSHREEVRAQRRVALGGAYRWWGF